MLTDPLPSTLHSVLLLRLLLLWSRHLVRNLWNMSYRTIHWYKRKKKDAHNANISTAHSTGSEGNPTILSSRLIKRLNKFYASHLILNTTLQKV